MAWTRGQGTSRSRPSDIHQQIQDTERQRDPKQNPQRKPGSRAGRVRTEELTTPVATESTSATEHECERCNNSANELWGDRIIL